MSAKKTPQKIKYSPPSDTQKVVRRGRGTGRVTITDVARAANVSPMTVSRALTSPALVQQKSRDKITAVIQKLGYVPNQAASTLASAKSRVIGVIVPSLTNAVFIDTLSGIRDCLSQAGYHFLIGESSYSPDKERELIATYMAHAPDGFLLTGIEQQESLRMQLASNNIPAVRMYDLSKNSNDLTVGFSQVKAGYSVARHFIERGYKRPAFIAAQLDPRAMKRREGFRKGLVEAGLDPSAEVLLPVPSTIELGAQLLAKILEQTPDCDAVFCCNDDLALGVLFECQRRGIAVPTQMAIAGFNDLPWAAQSNPAITTIVTPRYDIGYIAAELLLKTLKGQPIEKSRIDLGFELAIRAST
ncbi:LacI family DNA-binding transcriptional regulator [Glaciimonas sp. PCH181]|uniref:LacI family DNA-binding transcriptional regulator n=1 Tax=Glaciimonas sp. PCH181 TaxID=2133943 RepID=UPI000D356169|nr:LacI family DNA-binding transcriptional regulator [Glaciimonas sp. PCH181]PUA17918.1 transcriptional regulator [Glaciimonas sp. PCH181]